MIPDHIDAARYTRGRMTASILWLSEIGDADRARVGGKAFGLAGLVHAGFRVPEAFVIPADVAVQLEGREYPPELRAQLTDALARLAPRGEAVAVRSSATDEDGEAASFAGQHDTVLNVCGDDAFFSAIARCLASLHSEAAVAYRKQAGDAYARMAIVVQHMVDADVSGVAFSIDPLTGNHDRVVVEAVAGVGEALMSGMAEADRMVLSRNGLSVLEEHHRSSHVLTESLAAEAAKAALRAEEAFGLPQDIEFAFAGATLWMLQSRPITTAGAASPDGGWVSEFDTPTSDADLWTSANVQEILPGLLTPLTMSIFEVGVPRAYTQDYQRLKLLDMDENPVFMGLFYNRAFLNVTATRLIADRAIGGSGDVLEHRYLGGEYQEAVRTRHSRTIWRHRLMSAGPLLKTIFGLGRAADRVERECRAFEARTLALNPTGMTDAALDAFRNELVDFGARVAPVHLQVTGIAGGGFEAVARMVQPILKDQTEGRVPTLFSGMRGVESAQIGLDLWRLSRIVQREHIAHQLIVPDFDPLAPRLPKVWRDAFAAFLDRHGHRGLNEMEASTLTWRRDPTPVLQLISSYLELPQDQAPPASLARQEAERLRLTKALERRMHPLKRQIFRFTLKKAQGWVALRERTKSIMVRAGRLADPLTPELQRRMVERGAIERADDVFFVTNDEIVAFLRGNPVNYRTAVARRRKEYERNRHVLLPERFRGHPAPMEPDLSHHRGDILTGTPVSPGIVTGRARVILDPSTDAPIQPGEILVAPVTDAGWTPLFALASGLVVDMGSALSHGSTVAREYGLPAVVNVRRGTRSIHTGDLITVNGSKGTVAILEDDAE